MVKDSKKSSSAAKVVAGVPTSPVRSSAAEKGTKLRRNPEKKKKSKIVDEEKEQVGKAHADELEKQIVKLRKELDSQDAKRHALEARAAKAENKLQDYTLKLKNLQKIIDEQKKRICKTEKGTKLRNKKKKDTEAGDYDPSVHGIHLLESFQEDMSLPQDSKTLYATDIDVPEDGTLSQDDFVKFFSDVGKVVKVEIHFDPKYGDVVDFAKIEFESHNVAKKALEEKDSRLFNRCSAISLYGLPKAKNPGYKREDFTDKRQVIYVTGFGKKNILASKLELQLGDCFSVCGVMESVITPMDSKNDFSLGYAFIIFKNEDGLKNALRLDGTLFLGYPLKVGRSKVFVTSI